MTSPPIHVIDTGTRAPRRIPAEIQLRHLPALIRRPLAIEEDAISNILSAPSHLLFYSSFAAQILVDTGLIDTARHQIWAVGAQTASLLSDALDTHVSSPTMQDFQGLFALLESSAAPLAMVAFGLLDKRRDLTPLAKRWGVAFTDFPVYESTPSDTQAIQRAFQDSPPHWLTFTSSRGVHAIANALTADQLRSTRLATIGFPTAQTLENLGFDVDLIAPQPDREALLRAIANFNLSNHSEGPPQ